MQFKQIQPEQLNANLFDMIGRQWMLIGAKNGEGANLMTASWGGAGILWNKPVAFIFVRQSRYTHELLERAGGFSLSFFGDGFRKELGLCGSKSGRDVDKVAACNFSLAADGGVPYPEQAELVLLCKKSGKAPIGPDAILDKSVISACYAEGDFHDLYIGEIVKVFKKA